MMPVHSSCSEADPSLTDGCTCVGTGTVKLQSKRIVFSSRVVRADLFLLCFGIMKLNANAVLAGWLVGNPIRRGVLHNYAQLVGCASEGANVGS
jgi:hypothetical protein